MQVWRRRAWWAALGAALVAHLLFTRWLDTQLSLLDPTQTPTTRLAAVYVREVKPTAPAAPPVVVAVAPRAAAVRRPRAAAKPRPAASAPDAPAAPAAPAEGPASEGPAPRVEAASAPAAAEASASMPAVEAVTEAAPAAAEASAVAAAASGAAPFVWPASTRIEYTLSGWVRGEVEGSAQVEWIREGERYQVNVDVTVGPSFAPLARRRMSSDGRITPEGLRPLRYDQVTTQLLGEARLARMQFDDERIWLANGTAVPQQPGVQDTASQFVQLVWLFTTDPSRLQVGRSVEFPLALPRRVEAWVFDVVGSVRVPTPDGEVEAFHVKPRRPARTGDLTAEIWFAPALQYLPVRVRIAQDAENYLELAMRGLPKQAAP